MKDEFKLLCRLLYFEGITPLDKSNFKSVRFAEMVEIAKEYFERDDYEGFAGGFQEGQYYIELWTAHLLLEYGHANQNLVLYSIEVIKKYAENSINEKVSIEEAYWLKENENRYIE